MGKSFSFLRKLRASIKSLSFPVPVQMDQNITCDMTGLSSLPEEVLQILLLKYMNSQDVHRFCLAFPQNTKMMDVNKPLWLFDMVFPLAGVYLTKEDILNLRLVCKRWRRYVDSIFEENHIKFGFFLEKIKLCSIDCNKIVKLSLTENIYENGKEYFPLGRSAKLYFGHSTNEDNKLSRFLVKYGLQISHLKLYVNCATTNSYIDYLCYIFQQCKNLKSLELIGILTIRGIPFPALQLSSDPSSEYDRLKSCWPKSLNCIFYQGRDHFEESMLQEICLAVMNSDKESIGMLKPSLISKDDCGNIVDIDFEIRCCSQLVSLMGLQFPLKRLSVCLKFTSTDPNGELVLHLLCKVIQQFETTLQILLIKIEDLSLSYRHDRFRYSFLDLPNLKQLLIKNFPPHAYSMIEQLKSLENLVMWDRVDNDLAPKDNEVEKSENLDIRYLLDKEPKYPFHEPYHSNLWKIFPRLKLFTFGNDGGIGPNRAFRKYRRVGYDKHYLCKFSACRGRSSRKENCKTGKRGC